MILPNEDLQEVYDGIWGYNAVIATASITCVFFAFSSMSFTLGMINLLATIGAQYALRATMVLQVSTAIQLNTESSMICIPLTVQYTCVHDAYDLSHTGFDQCNG